MGVTADQLKDRMKGSLVAGAAGDALGYTVEFDSYDNILRRYGKPGITDYDVDSGMNALISDDTQMTLFTAEGIVDAVSAGHKEPEEILESIKRAYLRWYATQTGLKTNERTRLCAIPELWHRRAPGITCMSALQSISGGQAVDNSSKGCGGIMRIAPVALASAVVPSLDDDAIAARLAGKAAFITHHHALSTVASAITAVIIRRILLSDASLTTSAYRQIAEDALGVTAEVFPGASQALSRMGDLLNAAFRAVGSGADDHEVVVSLGEGWVAEETLAIALASVMRHPDSVSDALVMAVNHSGDSDSTGAVAGNIIGAALGTTSVPERLTRHLELYPTIIDMADRLAGL